MQGKRKHADRRGHHNGHKADAATSSALWSAARQQNAAARDFTVNALLYDPFARVLYDYVGGVADCERRLLRTIRDPDASFAKDPARIMRAVRLAARARQSPPLAPLSCIAVMCQTLLLFVLAGETYSELQYPCSRSHGIHHLM